MLHGYNDKKTADEEANRIAVLEREAEVLRQNKEDYLDLLDSFTETAWIRTSSRPLALFRTVASQDRAGMLLQEEIPSFITSRIHRTTSRCREGNTEDIVKRQAKIKPYTDSWCPTAAAFWFLIKRKSNTTRWAAVENLGTSTDISDVLNSEDSHPAAEHKAENLNRI